jgi:hypothetical protein
METPLDFRPRIPYLLKIRISENQIMATSTNPPQNKALTARVRSRNQVTLPQAICDAAQVTEGSFLAIHISEKRTTVAPGTIILEPHSLTRQSWTAEEWDQEEQAVDNEIKTGKVSRRYKGAKATTKALKK